jgi:hypothetical protein
MSDELDRVPVPTSAGECATCRHARALSNRRGSVFVLCRRAADDERFRRYPPLPVVGCPGYERDPANA